MKKAVHSWFLERSESYWYRRDLSVEIPDMDPPLPVEIRLDHADETIAWLKGFAEPWMYNRKEIETGLNEGHYFAHVKLASEIIAYSKVGMNRVYVGDYSEIVELPRGVALLYHIYVLREHRKNNVAKYLLAKLLAELKRGGYRTMCCQIATWNEPSMRLFGSLGFERIAHVRFARLFGVLRFWRTRERADTRFKLTTRFPSLAL